MNHLILMLCCIVPNEAPVLQVDGIIHHVHKASDGWVTQQYLLIRDGEPLPYECDGDLRSTKDGYNIECLVHCVRMLACAPAFGTLATKEPLAVVAKQSLFGAVSAMLGSAVLPKHGIWWNVGKYQHGLVRSYSDIGPYWILWDFSGDEPVRIIAVVFYPEWQVQWGPL